MEARLRALKVVDLKNILARAQLALPPKANKPDLISKILDSQPALDVYEELHGSGNTPRPASTPQPPSTNTTTATAKKIPQNDVDADGTPAEDQIEQDSVVAEKTDLVSSTSTRSFSRTHTCIQKNNTSWPLQKSTLPSFLNSPFPQTHTNHSFDWSTSAVPAVTSTNSSLALGADISASASAPVAAEPSTAAVPATDTNIETASELPTVTAAAAEEEDEETKKRRARAARFGIPFVEKPKPKPQQQQKRKERQAAKKEKNGVAAVAAGAGTGTGKRNEKTKMQIEEVRFLFLSFSFLFFSFAYFIPSFPLSNKIPLSGPLQTHRTHKPIRDDDPNHHHKRIRTREVHRGTFFFPPSLFLLSLFLFDPFLFLLEPTTIFQY